MRVFFFIWVFAASFATSFAAPLGREAIEDFIVPPFSLGEAINDRGVWKLLNSGGEQAGYVIETEPLAPLPGFSGSPINILVLLDLRGIFMDVRLLDHNEPVFVSGLGEALFREFFEQYRGHSISSSLVVGTPYGRSDTSGGLVYLDGVSKATASVRIAHESVLAATLSVVREKMRGSGSSSFPDPDYGEVLDWGMLVDRGLLSRKRVLNREVEAEFAGSLWEGDDLDALSYPEDAYLDMWLADIGPPSIARALLSPESYEALREFLSVSGDDEPLLVVETARHGLVSDSFVRNTAPDWLRLEQDGFPLPLRDADLLVELHSSVPEGLRDGVAMIFRTDRRLGFDPSLPWELHVQAVREHGVFRPEVGSVDLVAEYRPEARFFKVLQEVELVAPWQEAARNRQVDLVLLLLALVGLFTVMMFRLPVLASTGVLGPARLCILGFTLVFVGWWGQGQLSIVTVLGFLRVWHEGGSFAFLAYDPFSLLVWCSGLLGAVIWGRGWYCGWLCPFGVLQEYAYRLGDVLHLGRVQVSPRWDSRLLKLKYVLLSGLVAMVLISPDHLEGAVEIEPFKTAITVYFVREWYYVLYALFWLILGLFFFKGFCRYVCPLGAFFVLAGWFRRRDWIERRSECGSPCQLCRVRCMYKAIGTEGRVDYSECFQCLDCVGIYEDERRCVPEILKSRGRVSA